MKKIKDQPVDGYLEKIKSPEDLKELSVDQLQELCGEIRTEIIRAVSVNGGHLASNLGVVELTVSLHRVFHSSYDKIVWDVGHQSYTHKMLTGRYRKIFTIRTKGGLSGFPNRQENPSDSFNCGHSSTSISAAFGLAKAKELSGEKGNVVAVIGDGALTGGLAYEGLNNTGRFNKNFIVVLNDNKMSISRNVGSMARYLANIRTKPSYFKIKSNVENVLNHLPVIGQPIRHILMQSKAALKQLLYNSTIFEDMGFYYYGPFDGHNIPKLTEVFGNVKKINHPVLVHVLTQKGKGYPFAEKSPSDFHGVSRFNIDTGKPACSGQDFSRVFGSCLCQLAEKDKRICAITAAMQSGTGLADFSRRYPDRFFDVGIAEEHAVTFAGGLAVGGMLPVFAVYSTFLQRSYDQLIHDVALQRTKIVLAVDRCGIVGEDGETHQGIFDVAFLNTIPGVTVFSPAYYDELQVFLHQAVYDTTGLTVVRYPRGSQLFRPFDYLSSFEAFDLYGNKNSDIAIITYGRLFSFACKAYAGLQEKGLSVKILKLNRISPLDRDAVISVLNCRKIFFFEEGMIQGGVGEHFRVLLGQYEYSGKFYLRGIHGFVAHATMLQSLNELGLTDKKMIEMIVTECSV